MYAVNIQYLLEFYVLYLCRDPIKCEWEVKICFEICIYLSRTFLTKLFKNEIGIAKIQTKNGLMLKKNVYYKFECIRTISIQFLIKLTQEKKRWGKCFFF